MSGKVILKRVFLILSIVVFVLLLNFRFLVFNFGFYEKEFDKYGVYEKIPENVALENTKELLGFLKGGGELETDFFNEKEKLHLGDVRGLIKGALFLFYVSLVLLILMIYLNRKKLGKSLIISGALLIIVVLMFLLFNFELMFRMFHEVAFTNDLWKLDPEIDNLIVLFPLGFFKDFLFRIGINSLIFGGVLVLGGSFLRKFEKTS
ncbi:MAG: DUF1461 domain-containing protein [Candidatus Woesearchaeota archaeon]